MAFDGFILEPITLHRGIYQGCPLSGILFKFYNTDLIDDYDPKKGETVVMFMDGTLTMAHTKILIEVNMRLVDMRTQPQGGLEWSCVHHCNFAVDKFGLMKLTRRREPNLVGRLVTRPIHGHPIIGVHKF